jgi:Tfp pilus assembly protein PilF
LARHARPLAVGAFVLYVAAMVAYLAYLEKVHVGELRSRQKAEAYLERGREAFRSGDYVTAAREWEWGLLFDDDNFEMRYGLALVYAEYRWDADLARKHLAAARAVYPEDPRLDALEKRIDEILRSREQSLRP